MDKYLISEPEALRLESFLQPMLNLNPEKRATADAMLSHEWFEGVVVQGEIELFERSEAEGAEAEEKLKIEIGRATAVAIGVVDSQSIGVRNASVIDPALVHALKPVNLHHDNSISPVRTTTTTTAAVPSPTTAAASIIVEVA